MTDLERCASEIWAEFALAELGPPRLGIDAFRAQAPRTQALFKNSARAVLETLKTPSEGMIEAGFNASPHDVGGCRDQYPDDDDWAKNAVITPFTAMIDHILEGE
jgi:hypothetical protein